MYRKHPLLTAEFQSITLFLPCCDPAVSGDSAPAGNADAVCRLCRAGKGNACTGICAVPAGAAALRIAAGRTYGMNDKKIPLVSQGNQGENSARNCFGGNRRHHGGENGRGQTARETCFRRGIPRQRGIARGRPSQAPACLHQKALRELRELPASGSRMHTERSCPSAAPSGRG